MKDSYHTDLMKGIIVNIRNGGSDHSGEVVKKSQNILIAMLDELVSMKDAEEKKRILAEEYGMIMTTELGRRIQIMCNYFLWFTEDEYAKAETSVLVNS